MCFSSNRIELNYFIHLLFPLLFLVVFQSSVHAQKYSCLRCGGDGKIEKECTDCPDFDEPKECYNCGGKGHVVEEKDRYFYSTNDQDLVYQLVFAMSKDFEKSLSDYSPASLREYRMKIVKSNYENTVKDLLHGKAVIDIEDYIDSWSEIELQAGGFWTVVGNFDNHYYAPVSMPTDVYAHGMIPCKEPVVLNVHFELGKKFVLEPSFYSTPDAINGSLTLTYGRIKEFDCEVSVYSSSGEKIKYQKKKVGLRQHPWHESGKSYNTDGYLDLCTEIDSWTTKKNIGETYTISIKFMGHQATTVVQVEKKRSILGKIYYEHYHNRRKIPRFNNGEPWIIDKDTYDRKASYILDKYDKRPNIRIQNLSRN